MVIVRDFYNHTETPLQFSHQSPIDNHGDSMAASLASDG